MEESRFPTYSVWSFLLASKWILSSFTVENRRFLLTFFSLCLGWLRICGSFREKLFKRIVFNKIWKGFIADGRNFYIWLTFSVVLDFEWSPVGITKRWHNVWNIFTVVNIFLIWSYLGDSFFIHARVFFLPEFFDQISNFSVFFLVFFRFTFTSSTFSAFSCWNYSIIAEGIVNKSIVEVC